MPSQVRQEGMWQLVHLLPHWSSSVWVGGDLTEQESGAVASFLGVGSVFSRAGSKNFMHKRWDWSNFQCILLSNRSNN
jgi:hypothetical protein